MKSIVLFCVLILFFLRLEGQEKGSYSFFIAGHTYGAIGSNNVGFHPPFKEKFDYIQSRPEIVLGVICGDIASPSPTAQDWDEVDADIENLGLPVYFAVGNHDIEDLALYEERYGNTYYHFIYEGDLFIVLDPNIDGWNISGAQLDYLDATLIENQYDVSNIYVFFHQLLWLTETNMYSGISPNSIAGQSETVNFWPTVLPLFTSLSNHAVFFAGDLGAGSWSTDYMYDAFDNIEFVASGMGEGPGDNFIIINVAADKTLDYDLICLNDEELECFGELTDYQITPNAVSELHHSALNIYPNPNNGILFIEGLSEPLKIELYDISGRRVYHVQSTSDRLNVDMTKLEHGLYNLVLTNQFGATYSHTKIIKD